MDEGDLYEPLFAECEDCEGTGFNGHDCGEDTCACLEPEDNIRCDNCDGKGVLSLIKEEHK